MAIFIPTETIRRKVKFPWPKPGGGSKSVEIEADFNLSAITDSDGFMNHLTDMRKLDGESDEQHQARTLEGMKFFVTGLYGIGGDDGAELPPDEGLVRGLQIKPIADALWGEVMSLRQGGEKKPAKNP